MTDRRRGMEGSKHRYLKATRTVVAGALLVGVVAVAGCGGGGSKKTAVPPPTSTQSSGNGSLVSAEGTQGLVGPADRSTKGASQFNDKASKIAANANLKTGAQRHGVAGAADC